MEHFNVYKILALMAVVFCVGCMGPRPHTNEDNRAGANDTSTSGSTDARTGAGTGKGGTNTESSGTGSATSGAGTGTGGTETETTGK